MKNLKLMALIGIFGFLITSCSNDDNNTINVPDNDQPVEQKKVGTDFETTGKFEFKHAGANIPFEFTKTSLIVKTTDLGKPDSESKLITLYIDKQNVNKAVLKQENGKFQALFLRNIKQNSMEVNIDHIFDTEKQAIEASYPDPNASMGNHDTGQFGWLALTRAEDAPEPIELPVTGKYIFDGTAFGGGIYSYTFTNQKITFDAGSPYEMQVLLHNKNNNKIFLEGLGDKKGVFYVIQLKQVKENTVEIARVTKTNKAEAQEIYQDSKEIPANFTEYTKESDQNIQLPVQGTYSFDATSLGGGVYSYTFTNKNVTFDAGSPYDMEIISHNNKNDKILLEGIGDKKGSFYVIQLKDLTNTSVKIARETLDALEKAQDMYKDPTDLSANFTEYQKN